MTSQRKQEVDVGSVLIVDDEPRIREFLVRWLTPAGHDTREAPDAETALELLNAAPSDVILCDVDMPGRGGLWLVAQLQERRPPVAIVLATANDAVPPSLSLRGNVVEYLVKPFERERVVAAVSRALAWQRAALAKAADGATPSNPIDEWLNPK
jgi:DNA-binding NtrC family response regulator